MAATRLLFGGGQDPEQVKQDIKATAWPIPMERYLAARPAGREACDPRIWAGTFEVGQEVHRWKAVRLGLAFNVWEHLSRRGKEMARASFLTRYPDLPEDPWVRALDVATSTYRVNPNVAIEPNTLTEEDQRYLGYWACATDDRALFEQLTKRTALAEWEHRKGAPAPWLGWCVLMGRVTWLNEGMGAGMDPNREQTISEAWITGGARLQAVAAKQISEFEHNLSHDDIKDLEHTLSGSVLMGNGFNALRWAVDMNATECLKSLLYQGVYPYEQSKGGESVLDSAIRHKQWEIAHLLGKHAVPMAFDDNDRCASLQSLAETDLRTVEDPALFSAACDSIIRGSARERTTFQPRNPGWGDIIVKAAGNPNVCPALITGMLDVEEGDRWHSWQITQKSTNPKDEGKEIDRPVVEIALMERNHAFMTAVAGKGVGVGSVYKGNPLLAWVAWFTPESMGAWLDAATQQEVEDALEADTTGISLGDKAIWKGEWSMPKLLASCPDPDKVLPLLAKHPTSQAALANTISPLQWARVALNSGKAKTIKAVEGAFGPPKVKPGTQLEGWEKLIDKPRSEALIDHMLAAGWPVDVDVGKGGPSLVLRAAEMGDFELVEKLVAHGANPQRDSKMTVSLTEWMEKQDSADALRAAIAKGQATWLAKKVVTSPERKAEPR